MTFKPIIPAGSRLTPLWQVEHKEGPSGQRYEQWLCQCSCGNTTKVLLGRLERGTTKSCGCLRRELGKAKIEIARAAHIEKARQRRLNDVQ